MKFADIEREFTKKVAEQLNAGKRIHAQAMGGSQGEIASVVFAEDRDGKTAYSVVYLERAHKSFHDYVRLVVADMPESEYRPGWTFWLNHAKETQVTTWYQVRNSEGWYVSEAEGDKIIALREKRAVVRRAYKAAIRRADTLAILPGSKAMSAIFHLAKKYCRGCYNLRMKNCKDATVQFHGGCDNDVFEITVGLENGKTLYFHVHPTTKA